MLHQVRDASISLTIRKVEFTNLEDFKIRPTDLGHLTRVEVKFTLAFHTLTLYQLVSTYTDQMQSP